MSEELIQFEVLEDARLWLINNTVNDGSFRSYANTIDMTLLEWAFDSTIHEDGGCNPKTIVEVLQRTDCAACYAPSGLIYNHEIAGRVSYWWDEIDDALDAYHDEVGENWGAHNGAVTIGSLVWFAVEWRSQHLASLISSIAELDL